MNYFRICLVAVACGMGFTQTTLAQVTYPPASPVDTSQLATKSEVQTAQTTATNAATAAATTAAAMPTASTVTPPSVSEGGAIGTMTTVYALANHTHASKARKGRVLVPASGVLDVTFATPTNSAPLCAVTAEATLNDTNVVNAQIDGPTSTTGARIRITRTQQSVVALLGLTVLSVPTQVATYAHYICIEP